MTPAHRPTRSVRVRDRAGEVSRRGRRAAATVLLVGATLLAGPLPAAGAATPATAPGLVAGDVSRDGAAGSDVVELAEALQVEYAGAVPAEEVSALVRGVAARLEIDGPGAGLLLRTTEAASRRALTDHLARGVPLPR
ncbi:hypothetical protein ABKW28_15430 [Nocardioides sp. 31GB23]|uniref:hypothetical protein n=1 Tax=Nocardioides sp. 31GB23 TaxID=3156065 RepID=UPI0032AFCDB8